MQNIFLYFKALAVLIFCSTLISCNMESEKETKFKISKIDFGKTSDGAPVDLYKIENKNGMSVSVMTYGGTIVSIKAPGRNGIAEDVVLGFDKFEGYIRENPYFGGLIGRYANRIAGGEFELDGQKYLLAKNNGNNHLHGGIKGFDKVIWNAEQFQNDSAAGLILTYNSKAGEEGYPGNLLVKVVYSVLQKNELMIDYSAATDRTTIVNLTNHSYFNLSGNLKRDILGHKLMINANRYTPINSEFIPTGEIAPVAGTPMDFKSPAEIGSRINDEFEQLKNGLGYDHNWVLNKNGNEISLAAELTDTISGRFLDVFTTEPGLQFYSGNFLDGSIKGKQGKIYKYRTGLCLEPQKFPNSPNQKNFPSPVLHPAETYHHKTIYKFGVLK